MKIAIVDDENYWRMEAKEKVLRHYNHNEQLEIDIFKDGDSFLNSGKVYDISFVDIEMPAKDGFDTISSARENNHDGIFVIMTTHTEMSRKGYLVNAFRYIDKANMDEEIEEALNSAELLLGRNETLCVNVVGEGKREVVLKNIIYIETEKRAISIHTFSGDLRCSDAIGDIENSLGEKWFYRSHNAYIINLDEVKEFNNERAIMSNGHKIDIARRRYYGFKKAYMDRQFECANG